MSSKGYLVFFASAVMMLMVIPGLIFLPAPASGTPAEVVAHILDPEEPRVDEPLNVTVEFNIYDEPLTMVNIQWCIVEEGGGGLCGPMRTMSADTSGRNYSYEYPADHFENQTYEFHIYEFNIDPSHYIYAIPVHMAKDPEYIVVNATMEPNTIHPNESVAISGDLVTDLGEPVEGALVNVSIDDISIFNTTTSRVGGEFSLYLEVPDPGYFILNLTTSWNGIFGYRDFALTVSEWTLPSISVIKTELNYDAADAPPGGPANTFYTDSNVTLGYEIGNSGNDEATNITANITITGSTEIVNAGNLLPGQRYADEAVLNTSTEGDFTLNITADWEQTAPFPDGFIPPFYKMEYKVVPRPEWTGHTVFVEMFTQTTCGPCVYIEETLEILHEEGVDFEYVVYVLEDTASGLIAQGLNITTTPVLFIDDGLFRRDSSSNDLETEIGEVRSLIEDAASLETAPVSIEFENGEDLSIISYLDAQYRGSVSGIMEIYKVETYSNLRNYQGIPMSHRYLGSVAGREVNDLQPGNWFNFSVERPLDGEGLVAVLKDDDGSVIQTTSFLYEEKPGMYLHSDQVVMDIDSPGEGTFTLTADRFSFDEETFADVDFLVTESGFPMGWSISYDSGTLSPPGVLMTLSSTGSQMETKDIGRVRYYQDYDVTVTVPENVSGAFDFNLVVESGNFTYSMLVVVVVPEPGAPQINITNYYLYGDGKAIYFHVDATGIPEGATVKGRVLPCDYGDDATCGFPETYVLMKTSNGSYRASVVGLDMSDFTHLTYSVWVEFDGIHYGETEDEIVEIDSLVEVESDSDEPASPLVFIFSIAGLLVAMALAIILFIIARRSSAEKEEPPVEEIVGESLEDEPEVTGGITEPADDEQGSTAEGTTGDEVEDEKEEASGSEEETDREE